MNMITLLYFVTSRQPKNKGCPQNPIKSVATTNTTHQEYTSQDAPTIRTTLFLQTVKYIYIYISAPPVAFWSCVHQKSTKSFGFTRLFDLNMKIHLKTIKTTWGEKATHTIQNESYTICSIIHGFPPCLTANKPHFDDQHSRNAPLQAHLRTLISPNR